jgi:hypothetical protein
VGAAFPHIKIASIVDTCSLMTEPESSLRLPGGRSEFSSRAENAYIVLIN